MLKKTAFIFTVLFVSLSTQVSYSQNTDKNTSWFVGTGLLYDWQIEKGDVFDFREASNIGYELFAEKKLNDIWSLRLLFATPGQFIPKQSNDNNALYDRHFRFAFDVKFDFNNAFGNSDIYYVGSFYASLGFGIGLFLDEIGAISTLAKGSLGYLYRVTDRFNIYAECTAVAYGDLNNFLNDKKINIRGWYYPSATLAIGMKYGF